MEEQGFMVLTLLAENNDRVEPSVEDLQEWASSNGISHPVLADVGWAVSHSYPTSGGIPAVHMLGPGMEIVRVNDRSITKEDIQALLPL